MINFIMKSNYLSLRPKKPMLNKQMNACPTINEQPHLLTQQKSFSSYTEPASFLGIPWASSIGPRNFAASLYPAFLAMLYCSSFSDSLITLVEVCSLVRWPFATTFKVIVHRQVSVITPMWSENYKFHDLSMQIWPGISWHGQTSTMGVTTAISSSEKT